MRPVRFNTSFTREEVTVDAESVVAMRAYSALGADGRQPRTALYLVGGLSLNVMGSLDEVEAALFPKEDHR